MYEYHINKEQLVKSLKDKNTLKSYSVFLNRSTLTYKNKTQLKHLLNHSKCSSFNFHYNNSFNFIQSSDFIVFKSIGIIDHKILQQLGLTFLHESKLLSISNWFRIVKRLTSKKNLYNFSKSFLSFLLENDVETNLLNKEIKPILGIKTSEGIRKSLLGFRQQKTKLLSLVKEAYVVRGSEIDKKYNEYLSSEAKWVVNQIDKLTDLQDIFYEKYPTSCNYSFKNWIKKGKYGKDTIINSTNYVEYYIQDGEKVAIKKYTKSKVICFITGKEKWKTSKIQIDTLTGTVTFDGNVVKEINQLYGLYTKKIKTKIATIGDQTSLRYLISKQKIA